MPRLTPTVFSLLALVALGACLCPMLQGVARASEEPLLVLVGKAFPRGDISLADLRAVFRGRRVNVADTRLIPINHPVGTSTRVGFDRALLGLGPDEVGRYWIDRRIRDDGFPPKTTPTGELAIRVVGVLPGAITYGTRSMLTPLVKALTIDGKESTSPGYALAR